MAEGGRQSDFVDYVATLDRRGLLELLSAIDNDEAPADWHRDAV